jgi:hypothetical protein
LRGIEPGPDDTKRYEDFINKEFFENLQFVTANFSEMEDIEPGVYEGFDEGVIVGWRDDPEDAPEDYKPVPIVIKSAEVARNIEKYVRARKLYMEKMNKYKRKAALFTNTTKKFMSDHALSEIKMDSGYVRWKSKFTVNVK